MRLGLTDDEIDLMFRYFDPRNVGMIDYRSFCDVIDNRHRTRIDFNPATTMTKVGELIKETNLTFRDAFRVFDENRDNQISMQEFFKVFEKMNLGLSIREIECLWDFLPKNLNGFLQYEGFCNGLEGIPRKNYLKPTLSQVREYIQTQLGFRNISIGQLFRSFDQDINGVLSIHEFRNLLKDLSLDLSFHDIEALINSADSNKDGVISLHEFIEFIQPTGSPIHVFKRMLKSSGISLAEIFNVFDINGDGVISLDEFKKICNSLNIPSTDSELELIFGLVDVNRDSTISKTELSRVLSETNYSKINSFQNNRIDRVDTKNNHKDPLDAVIEAIKLSGIDLYNAFKVFDINNDGYISKKELTEVFRQMKYNLKDHEISSLLARIDISGDNRISYLEFRQLFQDSNLNIETNFRDITRIFTILKDYMMASNLSLLKVYTNIFDRNRDGWISRDEMTAGFNKILTYPLSRAESQDLIRNTFPETSQRISFSDLKSASERFGT